MLYKLLRSSSEIPAVNPFKNLLHSFLCLIFVSAAFNAPGQSTNNIATNAAVSTSHVSAWENLLAIQNGRDPSSSTDKTGGAYGNWPTTGTNWVEYQWSGTPWPLGVKVDRVGVYWWTDNGGIMAPAASWLEYWNGTNYVPVPNPVGLGVALNQYNITTFTPVTTDRLRLRFRSGAASTGILEWKVYGEGVKLEPMLMTGRNLPSGEFEVGWKNSSAEYALETSVSVDSTNQWTTNGLPAPTLVAGTNYATVPMAGDGSFFRLHSRNDFSLQVDSPSLTVTQGLANTVGVLIGAEARFKQTITLSVSNLPPGFEAQFNPASLQNGQSILTLIASPTVAAQTYPITIHGKGPLSSHTVELAVTVAAEDLAAAFVWPKYNPDLNYNFTNEFAAIAPPSNVLNDCSGVTSTITLSNNWFCFRFGAGKHSLITSNAWIPMLQRVDEDFRYYRDVMGWPPDKRAKAGYYSAIYLLGSGTCVGGTSNELGGWQSAITYQGQSWPMALLSYYPVYCYDPACPYSDREFQKGAIVHELIHSVLADMPGCKQACWFHEGGNTWLQGTADAIRSGNFNSMGFLSGGQMIAPFMPIECYSGWLQDDSFGGPCAEGVNMSSNSTQICTWKNLLGGNQYGEAFPHFMGEMVSQGSVAWIWRYCTNRVLEGLATAPGGLGDFQTRRLWIDCPAWTARCYVVTTNNFGTLTPERRTLPGWSGANQIPLTVSNATATVTVDFTPLGTNMSCQLVYRATDNSVIYGKPVSTGACSLTPPVGKAIKNGVVVAVICNTDYRYNGESSRTYKYDYRLRISGEGTAGVSAPANIATKWWQ